MADPTEEGQFVALWEEYLKEEVERGGHIVPTKRTLDFFRGLFRLYSRGYKPGVVVMAFRGTEPIGCLMWGDSELPVDVRWGRTAQGWGTYVRRGNRRMHVASEMRRLASDVLREKGFDAVIGTATTGNEAGYQSGVKAGFEPVGTVGVLDLWQRP